MNNKQNRQLVGWWGVAVLLVVLVLGPACSREQAPPPPPPQQSAAPAAPAPAPAPGTTAPAAPGTQPAAPAGNISQIQMGMTVDQVKQIMGNPAEIKQKGTQTEYKYYTPQKVEVKFQNNQVVGIETH
ncbi:MAG: outer membrane protein assembly factor BamE [Desulfobacterota bacterium]|jgi:hypothetical protein|nr:outer membrane protein assembly factor BamE [Thermodesulfobacteriota bacterium]